MIGLNETLLNQSCSNLVQGTTSSMDFLKFLSLHIYIIPLLLLFFIPALIVLVPKLVAMKESKKWSKETFWAIFIVAEIIALVVLILTIIPVLPFNLSI